MRQHILGMLGNVKKLFRFKFKSFLQYNNFENWLRFDEIIDKRM